MKCVSVWALVLIMEGWEREGRRERGREPRGVCCAASGGELTETHDDGRSGARTWR